MSQTFLKPGASASFITSWAFQFIFNHISSFSFKGFSTLFFLFFLFSGLVKVRLVKWRLERVRLFNLSGNVLQNSSVHFSPSAPALTEVRVPGKTQEKDARNWYNSLCSVCWPSPDSHLMTVRIEDQDCYRQKHHWACGHTEDSRTLGDGSFLLDGVERCISDFGWPLLIRLQGWTNSYMHVWGLLTLLNEISKFLFLKGFCSFLARGIIIKGAQHKCFKFGDAERGHSLPPESEVIRILFQIKPLGLILKKHNF